MNNYSLPKIITDLAKALKKEDAKLFFVGGTVRDLLLNKLPDDFDIEVYGMSQQKLQKFLEKFGDVSLTGKIYGVLKLNTKNLTLDISVPRTDKKISAGHKGFKTSLNENLPYTEALKRRDFTINAILLDPLTGELIDPFAGSEDLKNKILRVVDESTFAEDPLRILRAMQFIARFDLKVDEKSLKIIKKTTPKIKELSKERLLLEWKKLLLKSDKPSIGLEAGMDFGVFKILHPDFARLAKIKEDDTWHPEINVWEHSKQTVDQASQITKKLDENLRWEILLSALCHDLGKIKPTIFINDRINSYRHEILGAKLTEKFLTSIRADKDTVNRCKILVNAHMLPVRMYSANLRTTLSDSKIYWLARKLAPVTIYELCLLRQADTLGYGPFKKLSASQVSEGYKLDKKGNLASAVESVWLEKRAKKLKIFFAPPENVITGKELIKLGFKQGKKMGDLINTLNQMYEEQGKNVSEIIKYLKSLPK